MDRREGTEEGKEAMNTLGVFRRAVGRASSAVFSALRFTAIVIVAVVLLFIGIIVSVMKQIFYATYPR